MSIQSYMTIHEFIRFWAQREPDLPAFVGEGLPPLSYGDLVDVMDAVGVTLNENGFGRNDRIAIAHPGRYVMAKAFQCISSYATAVPLNPEGTLAEFAIQLRDMRVDAVAVAHDFESPMSEAAKSLGLPVFSIHDEGDSRIRLSPPEQPRSNPNPAIGPAGADDVFVLLTTSGTTSQSKIVPLKHINMTSRNVIAAKTIGLTPGDRCLNMLRLFHSGGINQGLAASFVSGGSIAMLTDQSISGIFSTLEKSAATWAAASYAHYHALHPHLETHRETIERIASRLRFLRSGTGPLNPGIAQDIEKVFGVPIVVTFGSSEGGSVAGDGPDDVRPDRASVGRPVHDEIAFLDDNGEEVADGEIGEVAIKGDTVFDGYENDDAANRIAFRGGWFHTGDLGYVDKDGFVYVTGRIKELINRGGEKISPMEVDNALLAHPEIVAAATFPVPHSTLGEDVAAAIVPSDGTVLDDSSLLTFLRDRLSDVKLPRRIFFTADIPKGPTGKIQRHALAKHFMGQGDAVPDRVASGRPATELEAQLQSLWGQSLGLDHIGLHDDYFELGGDSLQAVELFLSIEKTLGQRLPRSILFEASTVAEIAERIGSSSTARCVVPIQGNGSRPPLFCVHDVNGHVLNFRALAGYLGSEQPVYGIQSVGLDGNEMPLTRIEDMAARYVAELRQFQPYGPYYLCGYSMGGWIAYEIAQQLTAANQQVAFLGLFDTSSRQGLRRASLGQWLGHHVSAMAALKPSDIAPYLGKRARNLAEMTQISIRSRLFRAAQAIGTTSVTGSPAHIASANSYAIRQYDIRPYSGDAVLFKATPYAWTHRTAHEGWRDLIEGHFETLPIPGTHGDILEEPHVQGLAVTLSACLDARQTEQNRESAA